MGKGQVHYEPMAAMAVITLAVQLHKQLGDFLAGRYPSLAVALGAIDSHFYLLLESIKHNM
ncbi:hypothetical protein CSC32_6445 [Pseudomonas aeruginosa]|nr:hypothetical protein CSC32_6445 [Pseudomonas aeruginosa]